MGVIAKGIPRGYQGLFAPVSLGYPLSVFNKNSTLNGGSKRRNRRGEVLDGQIEKRELTKWTKEQGRGQREEGGEDRTKTHYDVIDVY